MKHFGTGSADRQRMRCPNRVTWKTGSQGTKVGALKKQAVKQRAYGRLNEG